jgi:hypothetical protein
MPNYMLLLYAEPTDDPQVQAEREKTMPQWIDLDARMREAGVLVSSDRLHNVEAATTVRVREGDTELTDGPFAITKEILGGYYVISCSDLDEATKWAAQVPIATMGSVEVRPIVANPLEWHEHVEAARA